MVQTMVASPAILAGRRGGMAWAWRGAGNREGCPYGGIRPAIVVGVQTKEMRLSLSFSIFLYMKVYLDNCCYNRPYDDQSNIINRLETEAKLFIQDNIKENNLELVWSSVNDFENNANISQERAERIAEWKYIATENRVLNESILDKALELEKIGLRAKDALHIACAIDAQCDFFITTDKKILNKNVSEINLVNPIIFVEENFYEK